MVDSLTRALATTASWFGARAFDRAIIMLAVFVGVCFAAMTDVPAASSTRIFSIAGTGQDRATGLGGPATLAGIGTPGGLAALPDGGYLVSSSSNRVLRVHPDGNVGVVVGDGRPRNSGDGGPAAMASVAAPGALALMPDGGFIVASRYRVRRIWPDGRITTVAGTGKEGDQGDGGPAIRARISGADALAALPGGGFLLSGALANRIRQVGPDGLITTVAGSGEFGFSRDGSAAATARLALDNGDGLLALPDGGFLFSDSLNNRIRHVGTDGVLTTVAGGRGSRLFRPQDFVRAPAGGWFATEGYVGGPIVHVSHDGKTIDKLAGGVAAALWGRGTGMLNGDGGYGTGARLGDGGHLDIDLSSDGGLLIGDGSANRVRHLSLRQTSRPAGAIVGVRVRRRAVFVTVRSTVAAEAHVRVMVGSRIVGSRTGDVRPGLTRLRATTGSRSGVHVAQVLINLPGAAPLFDEVGVLRGGLTMRVARAALRRFERYAYFARPVGRCIRWSTRRVDCVLTTLGSRQCDVVGAAMLSGSGIPTRRVYACGAGRSPFRSQPRWYQDPRERLPMIDPRESLPPKSRGAN
jgi:hypothetical protein